MCVCFCTVSCLSSKWTQWWHLAEVGDFFFFFRPAQMQSVCPLSSDRRVPPNLQHCFEFHVPWQGSGEPSGDAWQDPGGLHAVWVNVLKQKLCQARLRYEVWPYRPNEVSTTRYSPTGLEIRHFARTSEFLAHLPYVSPVILTGWLASFTG